jgi:hypothetical protein
MLISADWKCKNFTECAEIERNEKINEELKFIGSAKQHSNQMLNNLKKEQERTSRNLHIFQM